MDVENVDALGYVLNTESILGAKVFGAHLRILFQLKPAVALQVQLGTGTALQAN